MFGFRREKQPSQSQPKQEGTGQAGIKIVGGDQTQVGLNELVAMLARQSLQQQTLDARAHLMPVDPTDPGSPSILENRLSQIGYSQNQIRGALLNVTEQAYGVTHPDLAQARDLRNRETQRRAYLEALNSRPRHIKIATGIGGTLINASNTILGCVREIVRPTLMDPYKIQKLPPRYQRRNGRR